MNGYYIVGLVVIVGVFLLIRCTKPKLKNVYQFKEALLSTDEVELLQLINTYRQSELLPDKFASGLEATHCLYMIMKGEASHDNLSDRIRALLDGGAEYVEEVVAYGQRTPKGAFESFIRSPKHKRTLDKDIWDYCGICVATDEKGKKYYAVIFFQI